MNRCGFDEQYPVIFPYSQKDESLRRIKIVHENEEHSPGKKVFKVYQWDIPHHITGMEAHNESMVNFFSDNPSLFFAFNKKFQHEKQVDVERHCLRFGGCARKLWPASNDLHSNLGKICRTFRACW
jgi:hypothetical protein